VIALAAVQLPAIQRALAQQPAQPEQPAAPAPASDRPKTLEERVKELEEELERLKLRMPEEGEEEDEEAAAPVAAPPAAMTSPNALNPTVTVVGNNLYRYDDQPVLLEDGTPVDNQFNLREVEADFRAAVDPFADGVFILSAESEVPGEYDVGVEEGYVIIKRLPIPVLDEPPLGLQLKVGRFRPEIGRINVLHLHDLPQMTRPITTDEWFGEEGYVGNGISGRVLLPTPFDEESALELVGQILTGGGIAVADGSADSPAEIANLRWFRTFGGGAHNIDLSLIFHHGRTDPAAKKDAFTYSADFLYKWKPLRMGEFHSFVLGGQGFLGQRDFSEEIDADGDGEPDSLLEGSASPNGYFAFAQYQTTRTTYLGVRWDDTSTIVDDDLRRRDIGGYATWYTSEFLRFRLGYEHRLSDLEQEDGRNSVFAELNVVIGAHPPEPFWVNK
jgi:hypothetical protein